MNHKQVDIFGKAHPDGLMTVEEAADRLRCSCSFIYARIADGSFSHFRLGNGTQGCLRIGEEHLLDYMRAREGGGGEP